MTTYTAFLSYRRSDGKTTANWLRNALQAFRPPRAMRKDYPEHIRVFLDTAYERGAHDFYEKTIQPALLASRHLIVIATPDAASRGGRVEDDWMAREIADFSAGPNAQNLIIVRAAGEFDGPLPGNLKEAYPNAQIIDLRGVTERNPFYFGRAAFFDNEKLKIIAALLEVPLEDMPMLRREEERKRQSRVGLVGGLTAAALAASIGVSVYSIRAQMRGQQSLNQSLASVDSIVLQSASGQWNNAEYKRESKALIRIACNIANQLVLETSETRDPASAAVCDLEYLVNFPPAEEASEPQREFARTEYARLAKAAKSHYDGIDLAGSPTQTNLSAKDNAGKLMMDVMVNHHAYFTTPEAQAGPAEFNLAVATGGAIKATIGNATAEADPTTQETAVNLAGRWFELASLGYYRRLFATLERGEGTDDQSLLKQLMNLEGSVGELANKGLPQPVVSSFRTNLYLCIMMVETQVKDQQAAAALLESAEAVLDRLPADESGEYRLRLRLRQWETRKDGVDADDYPALDALLKEVDAGAGFLESAGGNEQQQYRQFRTGLVDSMHDALDKMRAEADRLTTQDELAAARDLIEREMTLRADLYRRSEDTSDWSKIWMLLGDAKLAALDAQVGKIREADERRRNIFGALVRNAFQTGGLMSDQADRLRALWSEIVREHHAYLDNLRNRANAAAGRGDLAEAVALLKQLRSDDRAWDILKADSEMADRVYSLETALQLGSYLDSMSQAEESRAMLTRAIAEFLPVLVAVKLEASWQNRADNAWKAAQSWLTANGISADTITPIEQLQPLAD